MTLLSVLRYPRKLAGAVMFSGWVVQPDQLEANLASGANKDTAVLWCHGGSDQVVATKCQTVGAKLLQDAGMSVATHTYPGMAHSACDEEFMELRKFLQEKLGAEEK